MSCLQMCFFFLQHLCLKVSALQDRREGRRSREGGRVQIKVFLCKAGYTCRAQLLLVGSETTTKAPTSSSFHTCVCSVCVRRPQVGDWDSTG